MNHDRWADNRYDHEAAKRVARELVKSCDLTPERLRELFPPPAPEPTTLAGQSRATWAGVPLTSRLRQREPEFHDESCKCWNCNPNGGS